MGGQEKSSSKNLEMRYNRARMDLYSEQLIPIREAALIGRCSTDYLRIHAEKYGVRKEGGRLLVDFQKLETNLPPDFDSATLPRFNTNPPNLEQL